MAPPYDVISPELQHRLYERSPYNIVRLILGRDLPGDQGEENRYARAGRDLREWLRQGILERDSRPALYLYEQEFVSGGERRRRRGFLGLRRLESFGKGIRPHESTLPGPKRDRSHLIRACQTNLSPIFSLYDSEGGDPPLLSEEGTSCIDIVDDDQVCHRLWRLVERDRVERLCRLVGERQLLLADGHHRYETALDFSQQMRREHPEAPADASFEYVMMFFLERGDPGLEIGPTHRVVMGLQGFNGSGLVAELRARFEIESFRDDHLHEFWEALRGMPGRGFGLVLPKDRRLHLVSRIPTGHPLDVLVAHEVLLRQLLGLGPEADLDPQRLLYTRSGEEVLSLVQASSDRIGILLKPPRPEELFEAARQGLVLPPKSTYFYPKLLSGLVLHPLSADERVSI